MAKLFEFREETEDPISEERGLDMVTMMRKLAGVNSIYEMTKNSAQI